MTLACWVRSNLSSRARRTVEPGKERSTHDHGQSASKLPWTSCLEVPGNRGGRVDAVRRAPHPCGHLRPDDWLDHNQRFRQRSEEHTSELQSLMRISYAVFCLHKKKLHN